MIIPCVVGNPLVPVNQKSCVPHFIPLSETSTINNMYYVKGTKHTIAESICENVHGQYLVDNGSNK